MSASGYKQTYSGQLANVRFTPESGHSEAQERFGLKKRTSRVMKRTSAVLLEHACLPAGLRSMELPRLARDR